MITLGQPLSPDQQLFAGLVGEITSTNRWSNGGTVSARFETVLAQELESRVAVTAASGTIALTLALLASDVTPGGEVVTSPLTFPATVQAIESAGLIPVFAGVDPVTLNLDPEAVLKAIGPRTVAIVPVHLFGIAADPRLDEIGEETGLAVVYDAAHAYGLSGIGSRGVASAFSLHATKLLHTGEGGVVITNSDARAESLRAARNFGLADGQVRSRGINGKMPELSAALGLAVHARLDAELTQRQSLRASYRNIVSRSTRVQEHAPGHARALVMDVVRCDPADQQRLLADLLDHSIAARRFPALSKHGQLYDSVALVGTSRAAMDDLASSVVALPFHGRVTPDAVSAIAQVFGSRDALPYD